MTPADYAVDSFTTRSTQLAADDLLQEMLLTLALAEDDSLDTRSALLAVLMVRKGATPAEAIRLACDGYDPRVSDAKQAHRVLVAAARAYRTAVSTGEGPAEQRAYDMHDAEADRDRADYDDDDPAGELAEVDA